MPLPGAAVQHCLSFAVLSAPAGMLNRFLGLGALQLQGMQPLSYQLRVLQDLYALQGFCCARAVPWLITIIIIMTPTVAKQHNNKNSARPWQTGHASSEASPSPAGGRGDVTQHFPVVTKPKPW